MRHMLLLSLPPFGSSILEPHLHTGGSAAEELIDR